MLNFNEQSKRIKSHIKLTDVEVMGFVSLDSNKIIHANITNPNSGDLWFELKLRGYNSNQPRFSRSRNGRLRKENGYKLWSRSIIVNGDNYYNIINGSALGGPRKMASNWNTVVNKLAKDDIEQIRHCLKSFVEGVTDPQENLQSQKSFL